MLEGANILVIDTECRRSADDCRHCESHSVHLGHTYEKIGWDDKALLSLSIGCFWDYEDEQYHWFDLFTLEATMRLWVARQPLVVSFNGRHHDGPLMLACLPQVPASPNWVVERQILEENWRQLTSASYDILHEIWAVDPARKFERGLNSLDVISQANGYGAKEMDGAKAPQLWRQGRYAEVIQYNVSDVLKTKRLLEQIVETGQILRGDGKSITLPRPVVS